jgi:hypothetical protein
VQRKERSGVAHLQCDANWGYTKFLKLTAINDTSRGYIVNDTLIIKCDMTDISSDAPTASAAVATTAAAATPTDRVAVPAGMYSAGAGGLLYIPAGMGFHWSSYQLFLCRVCRWCGETTQHIPQNVLTLTRKVDWCKPIPAGALACNKEPINAK